LGGKIGWTNAAGATYVGMARRHGVTLIVSLLHCPALTEIKAAKSLLNWGFAVDGKVRPIGTLVGPRQPPAATPAPSRPAATPAPSRPAVTAEQAERAERAQSVGSGPSVLAAAGFSCLALLAAGIGFAYTRRRSRS
jgi:D-alanyl-D-alanine carboxypeptidase (penicillin-binding protein 5/6)